MPTKTATADASALRLVVSHGFLCLMAFDVAPTTAATQYVSRSFSRSYGSYRRLPVSGIRVLLTQARAPALLLSRDDSGAGPKQAF